MDEILNQLTTTLKKSCKTITKSEARFLVDGYYALQKYRLAAEGQLRAIEQDVDEQEETVLRWLHTNTKALEQQLSLTLKWYAGADEVCVWAMKTKGIAHVLAAGLRAHIDITKCPTVGHIWAFAGLDPSRKWEKKTKRPWNADLKVICWKVGESFVKVSNADDDVYGHVYVKRKAWEAEKNENLDYEDQAKRILKEKRISKSTDAYKAYIVGKLPPGHLHARAKRYAVKLFLSHWHHKAYELHYGMPPPKPYPIAQRDHVHFIQPPNLDEEQKQEQEQVAV